MKTGDTYNLIADNDIIPWLDDSEIKYKWNGALRNLSDMEPEDYATTIFNVNIISSITSTTKEENEIVLTVEPDTTDDTYTIVATAQKPVTSDITLTVSFMGDSITVVIPKSESSVKTKTDKPVEPSTPSIDSATISPATDDTYQYNVIIESSEDSYTAYYGPWLDYKRGTISTEEIVALPAINVTSEEQEISFTIPKRNIQNPTEEEWKEFEYCLLLALPKNVYEGKHFIIKDVVFGMELELQYQGDFILGGKDYALLANIATGTEYTAKSNRDVILSYNINSK